MEMLMHEKLKKIIAQARGVEKADTVIRNVRIFHLTDGSFTIGDIAICGDTILAADTEKYDGNTVIDGTGLTAVPGFIDSHVHVESSMTTPYEFERMALPHGVTTAVCDSHELANTAGSRAIDYFLECARNMLMDLRVQISSCVPATHLETSGASLSAKDIARYVSEPHSSGLAEMMNVPGVLFQAPEVLEKIKLFRGRIDGHSPLLSGKDLNAYLAAGVRNCHESCGLTEAQEKLRKGMHLMIREGSVGRNLDTLVPLITPASSMFISFCTDDRNLLDVERQGHIDYMIARSIELGADPLAAYRCASVSAARHFSLGMRGLLAPGYKADIVLLSDLEKCRVVKVFKNGRVVDDALFASRPPEPDFSAFRNSVRRSTVSAADFKVFSKSASTPVIGVTEGTLITQKLEMQLPFNGREKRILPEQDVAKVAVLERYGKNGNISHGFVKGFGMKAGAIASSVGHDSHNLCVVGVSDEDMALAVNSLIESQGGFAVAVNGKLLERMPLPIGGLLSDLRYEEVAVHLKKLHEAALETDCTLHDPFLQLAFLPLPVIPFLRLTDRGLVDVVKFDFIPC